VLEQTADPAGLIVSSVIPPKQISTTLPQGKVLTTKSSPMDLLFSNYNHSCNISVDIVSSATSADQPIMPTASPSQRREIALKQVSNLISILYIFNI